VEEIRLTPTSYIVLGFVSLLGTATPYDLKRLVGQSVGYFWSFPHSQLYAEPERLTRAGYLVEERESGGRRRKRYTLTDHGREALARWTAEPTRELTEIRDTATLQLFFGADPTELAEVQLAEAGQCLTELEGLRPTATTLGQPGPALALDYGIAMMRAAVAFWSALAAASDHPSAIR
jgi:PadR family transcriptional regulator, regulatory protein AphA